MRTAATSIRAIAEQIVSRAPPAPAAASQPDASPHAAGAPRSIGAVAADVVTRLARERFAGMAEIELRAQLAEHEEAMRRWLDAAGRLRQMIDALAAKMHPRTARVPTARQMIYDNTVRLHRTAVREAGTQMAMVRLLRVALGLPACPIAGEEMAP